MLLLLQLPLRRPRRRVSDRRRRQVIKGSALPVSPGAHAPASPPPPNPAATSSPSPPPRPRSNLCAAPAPRVPGRRSELDPLGRIIRPGREILLKGNWRCLGRSRQQAHAKAAGHGATENAFEGIAA